MKTSAFRHAIVLCALAALSVGLYARTLRYDLVWDDQAAIVEDARAHSLRGALRSFREPVDRLYRPLRTLSFALDSRMSPESRPALPFHATNILLYALTVAAFYAFLFELLGNLTFAATGAALFAAHPLHTETVAWVSGGRADLLAAPFLLLALTLLLSGLKKNARLPAAIPIGVFLFFLAFLSKESTVPAMLIFAAACVLFPPADNSGFKRRAEVAGLLLFSATVGYLALRSLSTPVTGQVLEQKGVALPGRLAAFAPVFTDYLRLVTLPVRQCAMYASAALAPTKFSALYPAVLIFISMVIGAIYARRRAPLVSFAIVWWLVALLPVTNLLPLVMLKSERFLFLPSAAWCMLAAGATLVRRPAALSAALRIGIVALFAAYIFLSWQRMPVWKSDHTLWTRTVRCAPDSFLTQFNYGNECQKLKNYACAERAFEKTLKLKSDFYPAHERLGDVYGATGRYVDAIHSLHRSLRFVPNQPGVMFKIGYSYEQRGNPFEASRWYERVYSVYPTPELLQLIRRARSKAGIE